MYYEKDYIPWEESARWLSEVQTFLSLSAFNFAVKHFHNPEFNFMRSRLA